MQKKIMNNHKNRIGFRVDMNKLDDQVCLICGGKVYQEGFMLKKCSALQSPSGKPMYIKVPALICASCRTPAPAVPTWGPDKKDA